MLPGGNGEGWIESSIQPSVASQGMGSRTRGRNEGSIG